MKKRFLAIALMFGCISLLSGCGCQHEWQEATCLAPRTCTLCQETEGEISDHSWKAADCENPKTCSVCGKTEGEPLGHDWQEPNCETPKVCTLCGNTEGEALGHCFNLWNVTGETMSRSCETCSTEETAEADRERVLNDCLVGRWDSTKVTPIHFPMDMDAVDIYKGPIPYMTVEEGGAIRFFNGSQYFDGRVQFSEYAAEDGVERYFFFAMQEDVPQMAFALEIAPEGACAVIAYETYSTVRYEQESEEAAILREALVGTWTSIKKYVDSSNVTNTYKDCTMTFRDDHSFTAIRDGVTLEGTWTDPDRRETDDYIIYNYLIKYAEDGRRNSNFIQMLINKAGETEFSINFNNTYTIWFEAE